MQKQIFQIENSECTIACCEKRNNELNEKLIELEIATKASKAKIKLLTKMMGVLLTKQNNANVKRNEATTINQFIVKNENTAEVLTNKK